MSTVHYIEAKRRKSKKEASYYINRKKVICLLFLLWLQHPVNKTVCCNRIWTAFMQELGLGLHYMRQKVGLRICALLTCFSV